MRITIVGLLALIMLAFTSCQKEDSKVVADSDADLIAAIQKATNKQIISADDLPDPSKTSLSEDFEEDYVDVAKLAPKLGYEVDMRCRKGPDVGEFRQAYFDLKGRLLVPGGKNLGDRDGKGNGKGDKGDHGRICFELVYPVTFIMPDGTEITVDSKDDEEAWGEIKAWYEAHPDVKERPALDFPVDIEYKYGTIVTINNEQEMMEARKDCKGEHGGKKRCFELVLPVTFTMPDDSEITIEDKEDWQLIKDWYAGHPEEESRPELQFPVDIEWKDGTVQTINSREEMMEAKKECGEKGWGKKRCFVLVHPVTFIMPDGTEIEITSKEDRYLIKQWYEAHPEETERPELQFPVEIKYKDGTVVTINNQEEMKAAKEDCKEKDDD
jgi:hypothetical protein